MNILYLDSKNVRINQSSLIIKVQSLKIRDLSIKELAKYSPWNITTNGQLIIIDFKNEEIDEVSIWIESTLNPLGLKKPADFAIVQSNTDNAEDCLPLSIKYLAEYPWLHISAVADGLDASYAVYHNYGFDKLYLYTTDDLIKKWNNQVGNTGWTRSRGEYLSTLRDALRCKGVDTEQAHFKTLHTLNNDKLVPKTA